MIAGRVRGPHPDALPQYVSIPNAFVVGSGLDHDGLGRNLPGIFRIAP